MYPSGTNYYNGFMTGEITRQLPSDHKYEWVFMKLYLYFSGNNVYYDSR